MKALNLESSFINWANHFDNGSLWVNIGGTTYTYENVPSEIVRNWESAESAGEYYNTVIKNDRYKDTAGNHSPSSTGQDGPVTVDVNNYGQTFNTNFPSYTSQTKTKVSLVAETKRGTVKATLEGTVESVLERIAPLFHEVKELHLKVYTEGTYPYGLADSEQVREYNQSYNYTL